MPPKARPLKTLDSWKESRGLLHPQLKICLQIQNASVTRHEAMDSLISLKVCSLSLKG